MDNIWFTSAIWIGLALLASLISIRLAVSVALIEILIGIVFGRIAHLEVTSWINYLAGVGAILLTFLAGAEIDPVVVRKHIKSTLSIGIVSFFAPFIGVLLYCRYVCGWTLPQAQIAAIPLSTTSVAVIYSVMVETGFNKTETGKIILAACFITDLGTVLALGALFANYNIWLILFIVCAIAVLWVLPGFARWFFSKVGNRASEPEMKLVLFVLFALGGLSNVSKCEAVLPAYLVGIVLAPIFLKERELAGRLRVMTFTLLTPFYFIKAGSLVHLETIASSIGLIGVLLSIKVVTKLAGILPLTAAYRFNLKNGMYTALLMSTGLTFGSISALFGLTNNIIDQNQYTILVTVVIGSAVIPTLIAQRWFQPTHATLEGENDV